MSRLSDALAKSLIRGLPLGHCLATAGGVGGTPMPPTSRPYTLNELEERGVTLNMLEERGITLNMLEEGVIL